MSLIEEFNIHTWEEPISESTQSRAIQSLENGKVLFMPTLSFTLQEGEDLFLTPDHVDPKRKNISYDLEQDRIGGVLGTAEEIAGLQAILRRYASTSSRFLQSLFPHYASQLIIAKTSFRPTEIYGRKSSLRKDDSRLHVDAFPSSPTCGKRILRIFTNINPNGQPRVWKIGEPFEAVARRYACQAPRYWSGSAQLLKLLNITKAKRSHYDHVMLHMHNMMKEDSDYQDRVSQQEMHFPPCSSWIVFTDQVSHAALAGQYVLEQTFFLPFEGVSDPSTTPLKILEKCLQRTLID